MVEQIARVMVWLCVGEIAEMSGVLPLPGAVTGLILLYAELAVRGKVPRDLGILADRVLQFLGMLFIPAGVGVIAHLDLLKAEAMAILAAVVGGTAITLIVTAMIASRFGASRAQAGKQTSGKLEELGSDVIT